MLKKNIIIKIILFLLLGIFILSQFTIGFFQKNNDVIKLSHGKSISSNDFWEYFTFYIQNLEKYLGQKLSKQDIESLRIVNKISEGLIYKSLFLEVANKLGLDFSENYLINQIQLQPDFWNEDQVFDVARFEQILKQAGKTEQNIIDMTKENLQLSTLNSLLSGNIILHDKLVSNVKLHRSESRLVDIFYINVNDKIFPDFSYSEPSEEELLKFYQAHQEEFIVKEKRTIKYIMIPYHKLDLIITDKMINDYYNSNKEDFKNMKWQDTKEEIISILNQNADYSNREDLIEDLQSKISKLGKEQQNIDFLANHFGLIVKKIINKTLKEVESNKDPIIKDVAEIIFESDAHKLSAPIASNQGFLVFEVSLINPRKEKEFLEVKSDIKKRFVQNAINLFNMKRFKEIQQGNLDNISDIQYLTKDKDVILSRINNNDVAYPKELIQEIFALYTTNTNTKIIKKSSKLYFAQVKSISVDSKNSDIQNSEELRQNLHILFKNALIEDLHNYLINKNKVKINYKMIDQLVNNYFTMHYK